MSLSFISVCPGELLQLFHHNTQIFIGQKKKMANNKIANKKDSPGEEYNTTTTNMNNITNITIPLLVIILIIDGVKDGGISGDIDY